jgi:integrase/recombinase XerD
MTLTESFGAFILDELISENRSSSTVANYQKTLSSLLRSIGEDIPVQLLGYTHIIAWKKQMYDEGLADSYKAQILRHLRIVLTYLGKHGFATLEPSEIKIPSFKYKETAWLTIDELSRFLSVIERPRDKALFACLFSAGGRYNELISLDRGSIVDGVAKVRGKGRTATETPEELRFDPNALGLLNDYLQTRTDKIEALFISRQYKRLTIQQADKLCHQYSALAGIDKNVTTHVFRHSFATNLINNGADIYATSKQMRHARIDTTRIYVHDADDSKQKNYDKFHTPTPIN